MSISKEQWKSIEDELASLFGQSTFSVVEDGEVREILVCRSPVSEGQYQLVVWVDGEIKFSWGYPDSDEHRTLTDMVWRKRSRALYCASQIKSIEKGFGKRGAKKQYPRLHEKLIWRDPTLPKAKSLVTQFKKIHGLKVIRIGCAPKEAS